MVRLLFTSFFALLQILAIAQWNIQSIPDSLKITSEAVIRRYASDIKIYEAKNVNVAEDIVITVFGKEIVQQLKLSWIVNVNTFGDDINVKLYNAEGERVKPKKSNSESEHIKSVNFNSLLGYLNNIQFQNYPFTIELEYKKRRLTVDNLQVWNPIKDYRISVQNASLRVSSIDTTLVEQVSNKIPFINKSVDEEGYYIYLWELNNFNARNNTANGESCLSNLPSISFIKKK